MVFVQATKEDKREILDLYHAVIGSEGCTWSMEYPNEMILDSDIERNDQFCMKEQNGEIVGAISIDVDNEVSSLPCWSEILQPGAELARLVIKESYQNKGIARLLLEATMKELVRRGYKSVHFLVSKTNERAIRSYAAFMFEVKGESDLYGEHWWCYEKALEECLHN